MFLSYNTVFTVCFCTVSRIQNSRNEKMMFIIILGIIIGVSSSQITLQDDLTVSTLQCVNATQDESILLSQVLPQLNLQGNSLLNVTCNGVYCPLVCDKDYEVRRIYRIYQVKHIFLTHLHWLSIMSVQYIDICSWMVAQLVH